MLRGHSRKIREPCMRNRTRLPLMLVACVMVWTPRPATAAPPPQVSVGDAQSDFASGEYASSLRKISTLLGSNSIKPGSVERYDLLMLRGECMLRMKQP